MIEKNLTFIELAEKNRKRSDTHYYNNILNVPVTKFGCFIAGETGELCNILKKLERIEDGIAKFNKPGESEEQLIKAAADEIGDVAIYLDLIAQRLNLNLQDCITNKFNYNSELIYSDIKL